MQSLALAGVCLLFFPVKQPLACARTRTLSLTTYILTYSCSKLLLKQSLLMLMAMKNSFRKPLKMRSLQTNFSSYLRVL